MAKVKATDLAKLLGEKTGQVATGGGFLGDIQKTIREFRSLIDVAREVQGINTPANQAPKEHEVYRPVKELPAPAPKAAPGLADLLNMLIAAGHGDMTVDQLLNQLKPLTVKQLKDLGKGVFNADKPGK